MRNLVVTLWPPCLALFLLIGCSSNPGPAPMRALPDDGDARIASGAAVYVRYLGTGGVLIRWGDRTILTAPYFSGHSIADLVASSSVCALASPLTARPGKIRDSIYPEDPTDRLAEHIQQAEAIFVGHAHYDHLLDVPEIARCHAKLARVYASSATVNLLTQAAMHIRSNRGAPSCLPLPRAFMNANQSAGDSACTAPNEFQIRFANVEQTPDGTVESASNSEFEIRYRAVKYEHAPHFYGLDVLAACRSILQGGYNYSPPTSTCDWIEGQTFAYFFDFIRNDELKFRIYYNDASGGEAYAQLPPGIAAGSTNLAILTAASFEFVDGYPEAFLDNARPEHVLMNHWEDFFRVNRIRNASSTDAPTIPGVPLTDLKAFQSRAGERLAENGSCSQNVVMPDIGAEFLYDVTSRESRVPNCEKSMR